MRRNVALFPWFRFFQNLIFWQGIFFLYFQSQLSAAEAILLVAVYDVTVTVFEAPSGYLSDRWGRRPTLVLAAAAMLLGALGIATGTSFAAIAAGQVLYAVGAACASGTDTALLYESLVADERGEEMERHSLKVWRFGFTGLAVSAVTGGAMAMVSGAAPFFASALAFAAMVTIAWQFREPPRPQSAQPVRTERERLRSLIAEFRQPALLWLFVFGVLAYVFSHVPFVFGQPFIQNMLSLSDVPDDWTPLISGTVSAGMMIVSLTASLFVLKLRDRIGLAAILLCAFALQVTLPLMLALATSSAAILVLLLRMVPDAVATPLKIAAMQPLIGDETRATLLSLQSLFGKMLFAASLWVSSLATTRTGEMPLEDVRTILAWYCGVGFACLAAMALAATRFSLPDPQSYKESADTAKSGKTP